MSKRKGLGRGLDALLGGTVPDTAPAAPTAPAPTAPAPDAAISAAETSIKRTPEELPLDQLEPNRFQPRSYFDDSGIEDLAASISSQGVVQPIVVTPLKDGRYSIIAGERRWRAARKAGLEAVPVVVRDVSSDQQLLEMALVENIQRADLNSVEEAEAYRMLSEKFGLSQEDIGKRVGRGRTTVTNSLRLLRLPPAVQDLLREGRLTAGQARPLLAIPDADQQVEIAERAVLEGLTARDLEALVAEPKKKEKDESSKKTKPELDVHTRAAVEKLTHTFQTQVDIVRRRRGGEVRIRFNSEDELIRLYDLMIQGEE